MIDLLEDLSNDSSLSVSSDKSDNRDTGPIVNSSTHGDGVSDNVQQVVDSIADETFHEYHDGGLADYDEEELNEDEENNVTKKAPEPTIPIPAFTSNSYPAYAKHFYRNFRKIVGKPTLLAECKLCTERHGRPKDFKADVKTTSNWIKHLRRLHLNAYEQFESSPTTRHGDASETSAEQKQSSIEKHFFKQKSCGTAFSAELDDLLTVLFTVDNCPLYLLKKEGFKNIFKVTTFIFCI